MERVNHPHFEKIKHAIETNRHQDIFDSAQNILANSPEDTQAKLCLIISCLRTQNFKHLQASIFKNPPLNKQQDIFHLLYGYFLYLQAEYSKAIKYLLDFKGSSKIRILLSQCYFKILNYDQAAEALFQVINQNKKSDQINQYIVNLLASSYGGASSNIQINKLIDELKIHKSQQKDIIFNLALFYQALGNLQDAKDFLNKYNLHLNSKQDRDDLIAARLLKDYIQSYSGDLEDIQKTIDQYEQFMKLQFKDKNLRIVLDNNLLALNQRITEEHHHEQIKKFQQAINGKYKQTRAQILILKLNKFILQLQKNRLTDANKTIKDLETNFSFNQLNSYDSFIKCKVYLFLKLKQEKQLDNLFNNHSFKNPFLKFLLRIQVLKQKNDVSLIFNQYKGFSKTKTISENEVINKFIFSVILKDQNLFERQLEELNKIISSTNDIRILKILKEIFNKKGQLDKEKIILEKILKINPKDTNAKLGLAKIKLAEGDYDAAQQLLKGIHKPQQIVDMDYLQTLENNIHISVAKVVDVKKIDIAVKLKKKIKKHKKRLPKNFDPKNPGPAPNPERWLPKYERKDFKKKKNYKSGRTQGATNVGKETLNTFTNANTTSNIEVNKTGKTRKNRK